MDRSAQLNNIGVAALEDSNYELANEYLGQALNAKRSILSESESSSSSDGSCPTNRPRMERGDHRVHAGPTIPVLPLIEERNYQQQNLFPTSATSCSSDAFVYRKGFVIYPREAEDSGLNSEHCQPAYTVSAIESAFIFFNLGLVYHLRGEQLGFDTQQQQVKAVALYEMALALVEIVLDPISSSNNHLIQRSRLPFLVVAIQNNLAGIHYERGHYQLSKKYFQDLSEVLTFMSVSGVDQDVDQKDWIGLILNAMMLSDDCKFATAA